MPLNKLVCANAASVLIWPAPVTSSTQSSPTIRLLLATKIASAWMLLVASRASAASANFLLTLERLQCAMPTLQAPKDANAKMCSFLLPIRPTSAAFARELWTRLLLFLPQIRLMLQQRLSKQPFPALNYLPLSNAHAWACQTMERTQISATAAFLMLLFVPQTPLPKCKIAHVKTLQTPRPRLRTGIALASARKTTLVVNLPLIRNLAKVMLLITASSAAFLRLN